MKRIVLNREQFTKWQNEPEWRTEFGTALLDHHGETVELRAPGGRVLRRFKDSSMESMVSTTAGTVPGDVCECAHRPGRLAGHHHHLCRFAPPEDLVDYSIQQPRRPA